MSVFLLSGLKNRTRDLFFSTIRNGGRAVFKNGPSLASFSFIFGLFKQTLQFLQQSGVKNVHLVSGAGIRTHDHFNMSFLPVALDHTSHPRYGCHVGMAVM